MRKESKEGKMCFEKDKLRKERKEREEWVPRKMRKKAENWI